MTAEPSWSSSQSKTHLSRTTKSERVGRVCKTPSTIAKNAKTSRASTKGRSPPRPFSSQKQRGIGLIPRNIAFSAFPPSTPKSSRQLIGSTAIVNRRCSQRTPLSRPKESKSRRKSYPWAVSSTGEDATPKGGYVRCGGGFRLSTEGKSVDLPGAKSEERSISFSSKKEDGVDLGQPEATTQETGQKTQQKATQKVGRNRQHCDTELLLSPIRDERNCLKCSFDAEENATQGKSLADELVQQHQNCGNLAVPVSPVDSADEGNCSSMNAKYRSDAPAKKPFPPSRRKTFDGTLLTPPQKASAGTRKLLPSSLTCTQSTYTTPRRSRPEHTQYWVNSTECEMLSTPTIEKELHEIETTSCIPHLEFSVLTLESKTRELTDALASRDRKIQALTEMTKLQEERIGQEQNLRIQAETREKVASVNALAEATSEAREVAVQQVRTAMECDSNHQDECHKNRILFFKERIKNLTQELADERNKRAQDANDYCRTKELTKEQLKDAIESLASARKENKKLPEVLSCKRYHHRLEVACQTKLDGSFVDDLCALKRDIAFFRSDHDELKRSAVNDITSGKELMRENHASLLRYVNDEVGSLPGKGSLRDVDYIELIQTLEKELHDTCSKCDSIIASSRKENRTVVENHQEAYAASTTPVPVTYDGSTCQASPIGSIDAWNKFSIQFRQALAGESQQPCSTEISRMVLSGREQQKAKNFFSELCFERDGTPMLKASKSSRETKEDETVPDTSCDASMEANNNVESFLADLCFEGTSAKVLRQRLNNDNDDVFLDAETF